MDAEQLNEAFKDFTAASKSLESYYSQLQEKIHYLTSELEIRNRQLKDALADAESTKDHLTAILENIVEAIVVTDPSGNVTMMNRAAAMLLRAAAGDVAGRPIASLDVRILSEGTDTLLEVQGKRYSVIVSHSEVIDAAGILRGRVTLIQDITRLRELEVRHERSQRLISMGEMSAKLVHEIRNPLCSMELYASMLQQELEKPAQRELAAGISAGIGSLNNIMTNMLFFARPQRPTIAPVRLDRIVDESLTMIAPMLAQRNVTLSRSLTECSVAGDPELLKQVFMNILMNAVQAMPDGGTLDAALSREAALAVVSIRDTGPGIPRTLREKIFDPFFTTKDHGTGLGLAIAANIMQAINGYIQVESEPGKGSTFRLCFPVLAQEKSDAGMKEKGDAGTRWPDTRSGHSGHGDESQDRHEDEEKTANADRQNSSLPRCAAVV